MYCKGPNNYQNCCSPILSSLYGYSIRHRQYTKTIWINFLVAGIAGYKEPNMLEVREARDTCLPFKIQVPQRRPF